MTKQKINLENVELVQSFVGVEVPKLDIQNDEGIFVLIDESQWNLEIARGSYQGCFELLKNIKEVGVGHVVLSENGVGILIEGVVVVEDEIIAA